MSAAASIIIPVYNAGEYLERCVESVLAQTMRDFELICVDDGSTDGSADVLRAFAARDGRVCVIAQPNRGAAAARNAGLEAAQGRVVQFVDADDFVHPQLLETACRVLDGGCDIALFPHVQTTPEEVARRGGAAAYWRGLDLGGAAVRPLADVAAFYFKTHFDSGPVNYVFRREVAGALRFDPAYRICEDLVFTYKLAARAKRGALLGAAPYAYVQKPDSLMHVEAARRGVSDGVMAMRELDGFFGGLGRRREFRRGMLRHAVKIWLKQAERGIGADEALAAAAEMMRAGMVRWFEFSPRWWRILRTAKRKAENSVDIS